MTLSLTSILAITFGVLVGLLYLSCCLYSVRKALRDRKKILERNFKKRNAKYLAEMGLDSNNISVSTKPGGKPTVQFRLDNVNNTDTVWKGNSEIDANNNNSSENSIYYHNEVTNARKINLEDIDEILNESISTSSTTEKLFSKSELPKKSKIIARDTGPKVTYLKAKKPTALNKQKVLATDTNCMTSNWIKTRLESEIKLDDNHTLPSSYIAAQKQLQFGFKRAPLAKQNSGFSSIDDSSSSSSFVAS